MNSYTNEDVMWQRLKDVQREAENRRQLGAAPSWSDLLWVLGRQVRSMVAEAWARRVDQEPVSEPDGEAAADRGAA